MPGIVATSSVTINASPEKVWDALTNPAQIEKYLFGTKVTTDWKEGSDIVYTGVWEGKEYLDKGKIVKITPLEKLETTYWSGMSGEPDLPENYKNVIYTLKSENGSTVLTLTQDGNKTDEEKVHSEKNWGFVLGSLKKLLEG